MKVVLNLERVRVRTSGDVARGISASLGAGLLGPEWADAEAADGSEVERLQAEMNAARVAQRSEEN